MTNERVVEIPWMLMQLPQSGIILDVGSCNAAYLDAIQQTGRMLHCIDPRDCTQEMPRGAVFHQQNIIGNTLLRGNFDAVVMLSALEHMGLPCYGQTPFARGDELALAEVWWLLKPKGMLIVTVPAGQAKVASWYRQYNPTMLKQLFRGWRTTIHYWGFDGEQYKPIPESDVELHDYRDYAAAAGALAGIVAYRV